MVTYQKSAFVLVMRCASVAAAGAHREQELRRRGFRFARAQGRTVVKETTVAGHWLGGAGAPLDRGSP